MKHVLIVDDKEANRYYLSALLQGSGFMVSSANNGADALNQARETPPELVVSDLLMPVMDGYTLLRHWKTDSTLKTIPFVVYTATYTEQDDRKLALEMGADGFILKPCEPEDFIDELHTIEQRVTESGAASPVCSDEDSGDLYKLYSESLIRKLEEKTLELEAANAKLEAELCMRKDLETQVLRAQRLESVGIMAGGVAHDLNNLLSPILMGVGFARQFDLPDPVRHVINTIEESAKRGAALVRQVLSFARGSEEQPRQEFDLSTLLPEVKSLVAKSLPREIQFNLEIEKNLPKVLADPTQISQVWLNLCLNARDAMPSGGIVRVCLKKSEWSSNSEAPDCLIGKSRDGLYVCVEVTDEGTGIAKADLEKIFNPFFSTKPADKGTGLGLATVASIVQCHGGFITVESELSTGTTFRVYIPVCEAAASGTSKPQSLADFAQGEGACVLVVDDEASIRNITSQALQSFGYSVITAEGGPEGLQLFRRHHDKIDVVITDLGMPCMDGAALVQAIREIDPDTRIIVTSGNEITTELESRLGEIRFLQKPFSVKDLLRCLQTLLAS